MSKKNHILIVDDNLINRQYFSMSLNKSGHNTKVVESGFKAIIEAKKRRYDVILMDIRMSEMDGYETTHYIKQLPNYANVPILAVSAEPIAKKNQKIFDGFLLKPASPKQLAEAIETLKLKSLGPKIFNRSDALQYAYDDETILNKLTALFIEDLPKELALLNHSVTHIDHETSLALIHKLRGSSKTCGADLFDHQLCELSDTIKKSLNEEIKKNIQRVNEAAEHYIKAIEKLH